MSFIESADDPFKTLHELMKKGGYRKIEELLLCPDGVSIRSPFDFDNNHAFYLLGDIAFNEQKYTRAEYFFERSIESRKDDLEAILALANCFDAQGFAEKARKVLIKAQALKPHDLSIRFNLANAYFDLGQFSKAIKCYSSVVRSRNSTLSSAAKRNLSLARFRLKKNKD